jgi:hypothetical protein
MTHPVIAPLDHPLSASGKRVPNYSFHLLCAAERAGQRSVAGVSQLSLNKEGFYTPSTLGRVGERLFTLFAQQRGSASEA